MISMKNRDKIGLFFGSFNPIHIGHLAIANYFYAFTDLDAVWFVVSPQNPLKESQTLLDGQERLRMTELAVGDYAGFRVCDAEFHLPKPSYTIDTLKYLQENHPEKTFCLIIGEDNLAAFHRWKDWEKILENHEIYIYNRPGSLSSSLPSSPNIKMFDAPLLDISSTFIRQALREKRDIRFFLPEKAYDYIVERGLYKSDF